MEIEIKNVESLISFLNKLIDLFPNLRDIVKNLIESRGEYLLLINDVDIGVYGDLSVINIKNSDVLIFIPIVHGGM